MKNATEVLTAPVRLTFPNLFQPSRGKNGEGKPKYRAVLLFPPDYDLKPLAAAAQAAMIEKWGKKVALKEQNRPVKPFTFK